MAIKSSANQAGRMNVKLRGDSFRSSPGHCLNRSVAGQSVSVDRADRQDFIGSCGCDVRPGTEQVTDVCDLEAREIKCGSFGRIRRADQNSHRVQFVRNQLKMHDGVSIKTLAVRSAS